MYHSSYCLDLLLMKFIGTFMYNIIIIIIIIIISFMQGIYTYLMYIGPCIIVIVEE